MAWGKRKPPADKPRWNQDDYHKEFAGKLKEQIAQGVAPWQKPWKPGGLDPVWWTSSERGIRCRP